MFCQVITDTGWENPSLLNQPGLICGARAKFVV